MAGSYQPRLTDPGPDAAGPEAVATRLATGQRAIPLKIVTRRVTAACQREVRILLVVDGNAYPDVLRAPDRGDRLSR